MDQSDELVRVLCGVVGFYCTQDLLQAIGWCELVVGRGGAWVRVDLGWLRLLVQVQIE